MTKKRKNKETRQIKFQERQQRKSEEKNKQAKKINQGFIIVFSVFAFFLIGAPFLNKLYKNFQRKQKIELAEESQQQIDNEIQLDKDLKSFFSAKANAKEINRLQSKPSLLEQVVYLEKKIKKDFTVNEIESFLRSGLEIVKKSGDQDNLFLLEEDKAWTIMSCYFDILNCSYMSEYDRDENGLLLIKKYPDKSLFHHIVKNQKGTCVNMPIYVLLMAEKLNYPIYLSRAILNQQGHYFCIWDDGKKQFNIETTTGSSDRSVGLSDRGYLKHMKGLERAIEKGVYLRPLKTKDEILSALYSNRAQYYFYESRADYQNRNAVQDWINAVYLDSRNVSAIWHLTESSIRAGRFALAQDLLNHQKYNLEIDNENFRSYATFAQEAIDNHMAKFEQEFKKYISKKHQ